MKTRKLLFILCSSFLLTGCSLFGGTTSSSKEEPSSEPDPEGQSFDINGTLMSDTIYGGNSIFIFNSEMKNVEIKSYLTLEDYFDEKEAIDRVYELSYEYVGESLGGHKVYLESAAVVETDELKYCFFYEEKYGGDLYLAVSSLYDLEQEVGKMVNKDDVNLDVYLEVENGYYQSKETTKYYSSKNAEPEDKYILMVWEDLQVEFYHKELPSRDSMATTIGSFVKIDFFNASVIGSTESNCFIKSYDPVNKAFEVYKTANEYGTRTSHFDNVTLSPRV